MRHYVPQKNSTAKITVRVIPSVSNRSSMPLFTIDKRSSPYKEKDTWWDTLVIVYNEYARGESSQVLRKKVGKRAILTFAAAATKTEDLRPGERDTVRRWWLDMQEDLRALADPGTPDEILRKLCRRI